MIPILRSLLEQGITRVLTSPETRARLLAAPGAVDPSSLHALSDRTPIGDAAVPVDFLPLDQVAAPAGAAVHLPGQAVLFAGPLVVHGPRAALAGSDTAAVGRGPAPAGGPRAGARRPRVRLVGRPRAPHPPAPVPDRAPPAGRLPHRPGPARMPACATRSASPPTASSGCPTATRPPRTSSTSTAS